ncbi:hypothetical protein G6514_003004 [Epicoccum nigrum]|nr:hypothetical protein G6514_003004 [Epicoccum nigrum]
MLFKERAVMKSLLEEGRKKRNQGRDGDEEPQREPKKPKKVEDGGDVDIKKLAARVKAKSKQTCLVPNQPSLINTPSHCLLVRATGWICTIPEKGGREVEK